MNSLAVLAELRCLAPISRARRCRCRNRVPAGRGVRRVLEVGNGEATLIDEL